MDTKTAMDLERAVADLQREVRALRAEASARRVLGRYMFLCDTPNPAGAMTAAERGEAIGDMFTNEGVWEGVGGTHAAQFGQHVGPQAIAAHMTKFYSAIDPAQIFNTHYLCSEQVGATDDGEVEGRWVQIQPWINDRGESILRSSRLHVRFRETDRGWKIARYRTENIFVADLRKDWPTSLIGESILFKHVDY